MQRLCAGSLAGARWFLAAPTQSLSAESPGGATSGSVWGAVCVCEGQLSVVEPKRNSVKGWERGVLKDT